VTFLAVTACFGAARLCRHKPKGQPCRRGAINVGQIYPRQNDSHQVYGGQERGGIATPDGVPYIFLFAGDRGEQYGYSDGWKESGIFAYTGDGQVGDVQFVRGNRAVRDHLEDGRDLLQFVALPTKGRYRFLGCFVCAGWLEGTGRDRNGATRQTIIFQLVPTSQTREPEPAEEANASFARLRRRPTDRDGNSLISSRTIRDASPTEALTIRALWALSVRTSEL
jgi:5-methylcytosine-specific restriction protein A